MEEVEKEKITCLSFCPHTRVDPVSSYSCEIFPVIPPNPSPPPDFPGITLGFLPETPLHLTFTTDRCELRIVVGICSSFEKEVSDLTTFSTKPFT